MLDWLEDDELDENWGDDPELWQSPTLSGDEVAWAATDDIPLQKPKLSGNVANHITKALAAQATTVWLMNWRRPRAGHVRRPVPTAGLAVESAVSWHGHECLLPVPRRVHGRRQGPSVPAARCKTSAWTPPWPMRQRRESGVA